MEGQVGTIVGALVIAFLVWKALTGFIKFALIGVVILGALYLLSSGGLG